MRYTHTHTHTYIYIYRVHIFEKLKFIIPRLRIALVSRCIREAKRSLESRTRQADLVAKAFPPPLRSSGASSRRDAVDSAYGHSIESHHVADEALRNPDE